MIVSHHNEFVFIKTRKTAGTSIEIALSKFCGPEDIITSLSRSEEKMKEDLGMPGRQNTLVPLRQYRRWDLWNLLRGGGRAHHFNHTSAELAKKRLGSGPFERYHKFCVVRNPWDRAVSQFFFEKYGEGMPGLPEDLAFSAPWPWFGPELGHDVPPIDSTDWEPGNHRAHPSTPQIE